MRYLNLCLLVLFPIAWFAPLMRAAVLPIFGMDEISVITGYYRYVVRRILRYYKRHGKDRVPQQGRGKRDDVRWVFAGPRKDVALECTRAHQVQWR